MNFEILIYLGLLTGRIFTYFIRIHTAYLRRLVTNILNTLIFLPKLTIVQNNIYIIKHNLSRTDISNCS